MSYITPIQKLNTKVGDTTIYMKRDDLLPFSFGGNKVRIAQEFYADLDAQKKNCMVGYGNARSNLCRVLANLNFMRGGVCHIISPADDDGERSNTANSIIVHSSGAIVHFCNKDNVAETVDAVFAECEASGLKPYYIYGNRYGKGNEAVPVRAYAKVYTEIQKQCHMLGIKFDAIFLATGTGMTQAGLLAGCMLAKGHEKIIGISVARKREQESKEVLKYINAYLHSVYCTDAKCCHSMVDHNADMTSDIEIIVEDDYLSGGYGKYDFQIRGTIKDILLAEGIALDPTYTGKAFYGMLDILKKNNYKNVLFLHTGGTPLFFDLLKGDGMWGYDIILMQHTETAHKAVVNYLNTHSREFAVPLTEKINMDEYVEKLLVNGYVFAAVDCQGAIVGVICGYANDLVSRVAFESSFVISPFVRGTGVAKELFNRQLLYCREKGMRKIVFSTDGRNIRARKFYEKMGVTVRKDISTEKKIQYELSLEDNG